MSQANKLAVIDLEGRGEDGMTPKAGHNNPPTPFDDACEQIENLYGESLHWLDGEPIDSEAMAEGVTDLLIQLRAADKAKEALRVEEKKPHDIAAKAVQTKFEPLSVKLELAMDACKKALAPWLVIKKAAKDAADAALQAEADEKARIAAEARQAAQADDLAAQAAIREAEEAADKAKAIAISASKKSSGIKVGGARAITLHGTFKPAIADAITAARHYWLKDKAKFEEFLLDWAEKDVRAGARSIPGFIITEQHKAQ